MKNRFYRLSIILIAIILIMSSVGCENKNSTQKPAGASKKSVEEKMKGTINLWILNGDQNIIRDQIILFNKKYPNITVNTTPIDSKDMATKYIYNVNNSVDLPDIVEVSDMNVSMLLNGFSDKFVNEASNSSIKKGMFLKNRINNLTRKGEVYGYPWYAQPVFMLYRTDILKGFKVDAEDIRTWDDYERLGESIKSSGRKLTSVFSVNQLYEVQLNELGTSFFDSKGKLDVKDKNTMKANEFVYNVLKKNINIDISGSNPYDLFNSGNVVSMLATPQTILYLQSKYPGLSGKVAMERLPAFENGGNNTAYTYGTNFMVSNSSKNKEYAEKFINFVTSDVDSVYNQFSIYGICTSNAAAYGDAKMHKKNSFIGNVDVYKEYINSAKYFSDITYTENYLGIRNYIINDMSSGKNNDKTLDEILLGDQNNLEQMYK